MFASFPLKFLLLSRLFLCSLIKAISSSTSKHFICNSFLWFLSFHRWSPNLCFISFVSGYSTEYWEIRENIENLDFVVFLGKIFIHNLSCNLNAIWSPWSFRHYFMLHYCLFMENAYHDSLWIPKLWLLWRRQCLVYPRLTYNSPCSWDWPWTSDPLSSTSPEPGLQTHTTRFMWCCDGAQNFMYTRQALVASIRVWIQCLLGLNCSGSSFVFSIFENSDWY